jgi:hypothetical protein
MKLHWKISALLSGALILGAAAAEAQRHGPGLPPFDAPMELLGFEGMHGGKVVKGAPFSATATAETTQTLEDGSQIHRTTQIAMYRDSEGRSRHEATFNGFGLLAAEGGPKKMVSISDPVAGVRWVLNEDQKVARRMSFQPGTDTASANARATARESRRESRRAEQEAAGLWKSESLGTQLVNGVSAEGTRVTRIIPAGQIGNDKALQIVSERWYSPDLQIVVKSTRTDPRFGTTTYNVTNIQKTEPPATLFAVPSGFTVQDRGAARRLRREGPAANPQPPED